MSLRQYTEAISDCSAAIRLNPTYVKAYNRRAACFMEIQEYQSAVNDFRKVSQELDPDNPEARANFRKAQLELKKSKRKDYYKILEISRAASPSDVKKAYRKAALKWHPDKKSETEISRDKAEKMFKEVGEAYGVLSDPSKKARYDRGQDLEEIESGSGGGYDGGFSRGGGFSRHGFGCSKSMLKVNHLQSRQE